MSQNSKDAMRGAIAAGRPQPPASQQDFSIKGLMTQLAGQKKQIQSVLPPNLPVDFFLRTTVNGIQNSEASEQLLRADRQSLFLACQKAAQDGVILDGREAALVVFANKVQYMPMVQGLVKRARKCGVTKVYANIIYQADEDYFQYDPGSNEEPKFNPRWFADRGAPIGVYAVVRFGEDVYVSPLSKRRIMEIAAQSKKNQYQYSPENGKNWEEWWKKAAIKNVLKYVPSIPELIEMVEESNKAEGFTFDQNTGEILGGNVNVESEAGEEPRVEDEYLKATRGE